VKNQQWRDLSDGCFDPPEGLLSWMQER